MAGPTGRRFRYHDAFRLPRDAGDADRRRQPVDAPLPVPVAEGQGCCSHIAEQQNGRGQPGSEGVLHGG